MLNFENKKQKNILYDFLKSFEEFTYIFLFLVNWKKFNKIATIFQKTSYSFFFFFNCLRVFFFILWPIQNRIFKKFFKNPSFFIFCQIFYKNIEISRKFLKFKISKNFAKSFSKQVIISFLSNLEKKKIFQRFFKKSLPKLKFFLLFTPIFHKNVPKLKIVSIFPKVLKKFMKFFFIFWLIKKRMTQSSN